MTVIEQTWLIVYVATVGKKYQVQSFGILQYRGETGWPLTHGHSRPESRTVVVDLTFQPGKMFPDSVGHPHMPKSPPRKLSTEEGPPEGTMNEFWIAQLGARATRRKRLVGSPHRDTYSSSMGDTGGRELLGAVTQVSKGSYPGPCQPSSQPLLDLGHIEDTGEVKILALEPSKPRRRFEDLVRWNTGVRDTTPVPAQPGRSRESRDGAARSQIPANRVTDLLQHMGKTSLPTGPKPTRAKNCNERIPPRRMLFSYMYLISRRFFPETTMQVDPRVSRPSLQHFFADH
ncbi:hypothetical protein [Actinomadura sp. B10D3]|uniref:hypothetical protein n=1 Tax=Actinomadura sp. B10D3 TaxID=3153557 RepID=UPI00325DD66B